MNEILDEIVDELPEEVFEKLNGGISLVDTTKLSKSDPDGGLYTLGEYHHNQMGRYISLYYGSICAVHGSKNHKQLKESLRKLVGHELIHHLESLAGARDLEIKDKMDLDEYLSAKHRKAQRYKIIKREQPDRLPE